jgi:hypothetical protein
VESEKGKGSCFYFILPFSLYNEHPEALPEDVHPEIKMGKLPKTHILLVEDETINQLVTKHQLESWELQVRIAANGAEAIQMYKQQPLQAHPEDIQMPSWMDYATEKFEFWNPARASHPHYCLYCSSSDGRPGAVPGCWHGRLYRKTYRYAKPL